MSSSAPKKMDTFLVVTNTSKTLLFFKKTFGDEHHIVECNNLALIKDILESTQIHIIFIDEPSLDQSVHTICQQIRLTKQDTPILIITHHLKRSYVLSLQQSGASGFVTLPLDELDVREKIKQVSDKHSTKEKTSLFTSKIKSISPATVDSLSKHITPKTPTDNGFNKDAESILMLEIDHFDDLSMQIDTLDMEQLLQQVSHTIQSCLRHQDSIKPLEQGKFLLILTKTSQQAATFIAENIKEDIQNHTYAASRGKIQLTVSIGLIANEANIKEDRLIDLARKRLDQAKQEGNKIINT
ncbi:MAG: diguanylate cyclase [Chlamydiales bacterium]|nr:diguanylate cyclase [Chlamydiales bacterium]